MSKLLRYYSKGNIYFVTSVTNQRESYLELIYPAFHSIFENIEDELNIKVLAWVILPDHFHLIIDPKDLNLSDIIKKIKLKSSYRIRKHLNLYRQTVWQSRFWDHIIKDKRDMNHHIDYIHYNPVKHNLVKSPFDWEFTSIHKFSEYYEKDWGSKDRIVFDGEFGE